MFAPYEDKWGTVLENSLYYRVLKCGVLGYGTKQEQLKARRIISRINCLPKLIVVGYFVNDFSDDYCFPQMTVIDGLLVRCKVIKNFMTGELVVRDRSTLVKQVQEIESEESTKGPPIYRVKKWLYRNSILYDRLSQLVKKVFLQVREFYKKPLFNSQRVIKFTPETEIAPPAQEDFQIPTAAWPFGCVGLSEKGYPWIRKAWDSNLKNLREMKELASACRANLLIVIIPPKQQVYNPEELKSRGIDVETPLRTLREFLEREKIAYIDLLPQFKRYAALKHKQPIEVFLRKTYTGRSDFHWNRKGNHLAGLLVAEYVLENGLLSIPDREKKLSSVREGLSALHRGRSPTDDLHILLVL